MASKEIRLSVEDLDGDKSPEVVLEFYSKENGTKGFALDFAISVSASKKKGDYDTVDGKGDADGDRDFDERDDELFIQLAKAAVNVLK